jgi:DNA invertase Pin-like site-specific DNA recombinase
MTYHRGTRMNTRDLLRSFFALSNPLTRRPKKLVDAAQIKSMRTAGSSWRTISRTLDVSVGTVFAAAQKHHEPDPARITALVKVPSKDTAVAVAALSRHVQ